MTYKTYAAPVRYRAARELFVGRILGLNDEVAISAGRVNALQAAVHDALDHDLDRCAVRDAPSGRVRSGRIGVQISPKVHARAARAAMAAMVPGKSFAAWCEQTPRHAAAEP